MQKINTVGGEMKNKGIYYGLAREFEREVRIRIVMIAQNISRQKAEAICGYEIELPFTK